MAETMLEHYEPFVEEVGAIQTLEDVSPDGELPGYHAARSVSPAAWRLSFRASDGAIYLPGLYKSLDGGKTVIRHANAAVDKISILHTEQHRQEPGPEGAVFSRPGLFVALGGYAWLVSPGIYKVHSWRSTDGLKTIEEADAMLTVPGGPRRERNAHEWYGIYLVRDIVQMPDGSLLTTGEGHFAEDTIEASTLPGRAESHFLNRVFVLGSQDDGRTWTYLATVAAPRVDDPVDEGFCEPTITLLNDGRLLCLMRTGHLRPMYASWSSDGGKTWTPPAYTGLERGCLPSMIKLADGRLAVTYGNRFPAGWSRITPEGDHKRWTWPGPGLVKLAISPDGTGESWVTTTVARGVGSCYTTLFEVEPDVLFCQVDCWYWRMKLRPKT